MKDVVFMVCVCICVFVFIGSITYSIKLDTQQNENFAKAGLEQCQAGTMSQVIWVKSCTEYINARKGD